ncbi:hypothetical protein KKH27_03660 [bacterium]|nr:hypothetical protein [bacterium]MBU1984904.1 hypothetical protein [bacterium]
MKSLLSVLLSICAVGLAQAQGIDACAFAVSLRDDGCTEDHDCISPNGCSSKTFSVPCTQNYYIYAQAYCSGGVKCWWCQACVNIYDGDTFVANCHTTHCDGEECSYKCTTPEQLSTGITYTLYVCLIPCVNHDCDDCDENYCHAEGCVASWDTPCPSP